MWDGCSQATITFSSPDETEPLNYLVENDLTQAALDAAMAHCGNLTVRYSRAHIFRRFYDHLGTPEPIFLDDFMAILPQVYLGYFSLTQ